MNSSSALSSMPDPTESQIPMVQGAMITTLLLAILSTIARFYCRKISKAGFWLDDWLILPALLIGTFPTILVLTWQIDHGFAKHIWASSDFVDTLTVFLKVLFIGEATYFWSIGFTKFSILALYWRIFKRDLKIPIIVIACIVAGWVAGSFITVMLSCIPIQGFWDKAIQATCGVDDKRFYYGTSIPNIITDIALLALPVSSIWKLKISIQQKFMLTFVFILGGFVVAISIVRLVVLINLETGPDVTWNLIGTEVWTVVEMGIAILSANLPSLKPLINMIIWGSPTSSYRSRSGASSRHYSHPSGRKESVASPRRPSGRSSDENTLVSERIHPKHDGVVWEKYQHPFQLELDGYTVEDQGVITIRHDVEIQSCSARASETVNGFGSFF